MPLPFPSPRSLSALLGVGHPWPTVTCHSLSLFGRQAIQNVGNLDAGIGRAKEAWMAPLQPAIQQGVVQMKQFILQLVDIEEKEGSYGPRSCYRGRLQRREFSFSTCRTSANGWNPVLRAVIFLGITVCSGQRW